MITFRRHGAALLCGLATGAVIVGSMSVVPSETLPTSWAAALGSTSAAAAPQAPQPPTPPSITVPSPPAVEPLTVATPTPPSPQARPGAPRTTPPPAAAALPPPTTTPPPVPTTKAVASPPASEDVLAPAGTAGVVALTNAQRAEAGCAPLRRNDLLDTAAQLHSVDMATQVYFSHDSLDGRTFVDRITAAGYTSPGGENIARGQTTAAEVVQAWMNSPGHKRNILDCSFTTIGVGFDDRGDYWTQDFGR